MRQGEAAKRSVCCLEDLLHQQANLKQFGCFLPPQSQEKWLMVHITQAEGHSGQILATFLV